MLCGTVSNILLCNYPRSCYLGHLLRLPSDGVVRRTLMAMADGGNRYLKGSVHGCQCSEMKDLETLAVNRTARRNKVATLVF